MNQTSSNWQPMGYATFFQRVNAFVIDSLVFIPLNLLAEYNTFFLKNFLIVIFIALAWCVYKPVMEWKYGATLGKMVLKMRVVDDQMQGISLNQALLRFLPYFAVSLSALLSSYSLFHADGFQEVNNFTSLQDLQQEPSNGGGFLLSVFFFIFSATAIFFDEKKQAMHDRFSHTYCILIQNKASNN
ncbi:RDD family protein [Aureispira anguillae]|uniref:RDD family protein n=1 Tax=Aureispira anguillae TaxID=2864201 RepID=A0A915YFF6_9BACT|nr:RDD family protein [Aureispira anguillae]BDS12152.1 RDD family protein [Aureispira anguillae]